MLIYISGAISSDPDYFIKFHKAHIHLENKGHDVINPAYIATALPKMEHEQYLHIDKALIDICDAVYFLKDWGSSKGAMEEYEYVRKKNEKEKYDFSQYERWVHTKRQRKKEKRTLEEKLIKLIFEGENEKENENG